VVRQRRFTSDLAGGNMKSLFSRFAGKLSKENPAISRRK
jgi:hypothetical protein